MEDDEEAYEGDELYLEEDLLVDEEAVGATAADLYSKHRHSTSAESKQARHERALHVRAVRLRARTHTTATLGGG